MLDGFLLWIGAAWMSTVPLAGLLGLAVFGTVKAILAMRHPVPVFRLRFASPLGRRRVRAYRLLLVPGRDHPAMRARQGLLRACGLQVDASAYTFWKRLCLIAASAAVAGLWPAMRLSAGNRGVYIAVVLFMLAIIAMLALDGFLLEKLKNVRRYHIIREIDAISRHLLYSGGRQINLHGRLLSCLPFTRALRAEWYRLTADWYNGAAEALRIFQERLGTGEARAFAETLNALRQFEDDRYYDLLKERIADNKEKMDLMRESRKEALSYLLLVLAGVPILFTFRVFIHPWVAEGQKLFQLLN